jgi:hypothetical protein
VEIWIFLDCGEKEEAGLIGKSGFGFN